MSLPAHNLAEFDRLRLLTYRLDLELTYEEQPLSVWLGNMTIVGQEILVRWMMGVNGEEAFLRWLFLSEAHLRAWARLEIKVEDFVALNGHDQELLIPQGPPLSKDRVADLWARNGWGVRGT